MFEAGVLNGLTRISVEISSSKSRSDDDFTDRLNHSYTTTILMLCTLVVLGRQFIGKPISCWTPNEFTAPQVEYATLMCWATSTYFIPPSQAAITTDLKVRYKDSVHYYQWVPFVLMFQAALFSVPCIVWRLFNWQSRIHLWTILDLASKSGDIGQLGNTRADHIYFLVRHLEDALAMRHRRKRYLRSQRSTPSRVNTSLTNTLLDPSQKNAKRNPSVFYGLHMLTDLMSGEQWQRSGNFPRVTFCDFDMRRMGSNYHRHTLQCVLGINMFNEKIFIFLWFWLVLITVLNFDSFLRWCCKSSFEANRVSFIRNLLVRRNVIGKGSVVAESTDSSAPTESSNSKSSNRTLLTESERKESTVFTEHILGQDGVFVLRLISFNVGCQVASKVVEYIWSRYAQAEEAAVAGPKVTGGRANLTTARSIIPLPPLPARVEQPPLPTRRRRNTSVSLDSNCSLTFEPIGPDRSPPVNTFSRRRFPRVRQQPEETHGGSQWSSERDNRSDIDSFGNDNSNFSYRDSFV